MSFLAGGFLGGNLIIHYGIECNPQILLCFDFTKRRKSFPSTRIYFCRAKMLATFSWERSFAWKGRRNSVPCRKTLAIPRREPMLDHGVGFDFRCSSDPGETIQKTGMHSTMVLVSLLGKHLNICLLSVFQIDLNPTVCLFFYFRFCFKTCDGILVK